MSEDLLTTIERLDLLIRSNRRYHAEAYSFVYEALDWTLHNVVEGPADPGRHVACRELLEGIRQYALSKFGPLAQAVFASWGVTRTDDWGEIVFSLIEHDLMGKQESDQKEQFFGVYTFADAFDIEPDIEYDGRTDSFSVSYRPSRETRPQSRPAAKAK